MKFTPLCIPAIAAVMALASCGSTPPPQSTLLPTPAEIKFNGSTFDMPANPEAYISIADTTDARRIAEALRRLYPGLTLSDSPSGTDIRLTLTENTDSLPEGSYTLNVGRGGVEIEAPTAAGLFYGVQTLAGLVDDSGNALPTVDINDSPRMPYRGMMLDVSRHFRSADFVKKQIDAMARLKLNNLHLHLTDAAGWRLEIDRYPQLTRLGAWRKGETWKDWNSNGNRYLEESDPDARGGYYTKEQMRDIIRYAADRYINIIPEIEMPGHSEEVLTAYPQYSCTHKPYKESDFCPGNDSTYVFLENVLTEVMELFPSKLIHIGGDEAPKNSWRTCALCQARMKAEGIENVEGLQSYLIHRIERFLNENGRDMLGWDEIMEGGLAPNATVMSWRGTEGGERAAAEGHRVVMTPGRYCYLDSYQDAPSTQPEAIGGYLPLELAYSYEPVPESLRGTDREHFVWGLQGNLFTEYVPTDEHAEYMLYPRMYAIAERAWSPADRRDYDDFRVRADSLGKRMTRLGYNVFDIESEVGNRPQAASTDHHLAYGKPVRFITSPWDKYPANGDSTLTDGHHGGWNYNDARWQGFVSNGPFRMDVVIDLGEPTDIHSIGADFMQICGPGVWMPEQVVVSASDDGENFRTLATVDHKVEHSDDVQFKNFGWEGSDRARYIRYQAKPSAEFGGCFFTDEIVVK